MKYFSYYLLNIVPSVIAIKSHTGCVKIVLFDAIEYMAYMLQS